MIEYHKIETLFERDEKTKRLKMGKFRNPTVEFLKDNTWVFTEKIDGTNIRVFWDGHEVTFGGRTDRASIPVDLVNRLNKLFGGETNAQIFEQRFGEKPVILFGEGYGPKIQSGGSYRDDVDFILFDVMIGGNFQSRDCVESIANYFGIDVVPVLLEGTLQDGIDYVLNPDHRISSIAIHGAPLEGLVGRTKEELRDRCGNRLIVKIKYRDFYDQVC